MATIQKHVSIDPKMDKYLDEKNISLTQLIRKVITADMDRERKQENRDK